jgi:hypothetical protein
VPEEQATMAGQVTGAGQVHLGPITPGEKRSSRPAHGNRRHVQIQEHDRAGGQYVHRGRLEL